jgi:hypothetical protein
LDGYWARLLDWLSPKEENLIPNYEARVSFADNRSLLDLSVYDETSANSQYRFTVTGKTGKSDGTLTKLAPGHYHAGLPISAAGDYRIDLLEERGGRRVTFPPLGYTLAFDQTAEIPRPELHTRLLTRMAQATGGAINPKRPDNQVNIATTKNSRPLRQGFIVLAFCLFLLEVAMRKFVFAEQD